MTQPKTDRHQMSQPQMSHSIAGLGGAVGLCVVSFVLLPFLPMSFVVFTPILGATGLAVLAGRSKIQAWALGAFVALFAFVLSLAAIAVPVFTPYIGLWLVVALCFIIGKASLRSSPVIDQALTALANRRDERFWRVRVWLSLAPTVIQMVGALFLLLLVMGATGTVVGTGGAALGALLLWLSNVGVAALAMAALAIIVLVIAASMVAGPLFGRARRRSTTRLLELGDGGMHFVDGE